MVVLTRVAGRNSCHIVLCKSMMKQLRSVMPEINNILILNNARWIDQALVDLPLKGSRGGLVLGHLSNLTPEKGVVEVVDLAVEFHKAGVPVRLILGGPAICVEARAQLARAAAELGECFEYRGPLNGRSKVDFFESITHFVFPSYNEALPLVLYEAMASGAVCVTTRVGAIPEQTEGGAAVLAAHATSLVREALPRLLSTSVTSDASELSRAVYLRARAESEQQFANLLKALGASTA